jgi:hypothetical protein
MAGRQRPPSLPWGELCPPPENSESAACCALSRVVCADETSTEVESCLMVCPPTPAACDEGMALLTAQSTTGTAAASCGTAACHESASPRRTSASTRAARSSRWLGGRVDAATHNPGPQGHSPLYWSRCLAGARPLDGSLPSNSSQQHDAHGRRLSWCRTLLWHLQALSKIGATRLVVGHTPQLGGVNCECDGCVWRVDVGMSYGVLNRPVQVRTRPLARVRRTVTQYPLLNGQ